MKDFRLYNGIVMPSIGYGVYQIPPKDTERCVTDALEIGYRMFDTASSYFNENEVLPQKLDKYDSFTTR